MTSPKSVGKDKWHKARLKIAITKRYAAHKMNENDDDFSSCFIDDDESDSEVDEIDGQSFNSERGKYASETNTSPYNRGRLLSSNGTAQKLLSGEVASTDVENIEMVAVSQIGGDELNFIHPKPNISDDNAGLDYVDMAISREEVGDYVDMSLGRGDPGQHKRRSERFHGRNEAKIPSSRKFEPTVTFGWFDILIGVIAIVVFFVDIGTDIELATHYFRKEKWIYGGVTTGLIVGPSLVTCFLGLHWYIIDYRKEKQVVNKLKRQKRKSYITPSYVWFLRIFFTLLQCGPVVRIVEYLYCGYQSQSKKIHERERRRYYRFMLYEDVDSCLLRLFESFLEAAPQLTWQLYIAIVLKPKEDVMGTSIRAIAMLSSWGSLAISLVSYHKSLRNSHEDKAKMTIKSLPFYFIWRACEIGGRVLCIAMFASAFQLWVFAPLAFHWAFISGWLMMQKTTFYKNKCMEKAFNIICGYVMIFCFLNLREGQTRFRFLLFYFIVYLESFIMLAFWFRFTKDLGAWFHLWGFIVVLVLFVLHIVFQILYYKFFHPTQKIKTCLPCNRYVICSSICYDVQPKIDDVVGDASERYTIQEIIVEPEERRNNNRNNGWKETQIAML